MVKRIMDLLQQQHCYKCVNSSCKDYSHCPVEYCRNGCGFSLHRCKWSEHNKHTCPEALVSCTNRAYGCRELFARKKLMLHIQHCPASTIKCHFSYSRPSAVCGATYDQADEDFIDKKLLDGDLQQFLSNAKKPRVLPDLDISINPLAYTLIQKSRHKMAMSPAPFLCNELVRRDEFSTHWKRFHTEIQLQISDVVQRCPFRVYGCTYGRENLIPSPLGTTLDFNKEGNYMLVKPPLLMSTRNELTNRTLSHYETKIQEKKELSLYGYDEEESYDVLGQLPVEVLLNIFQYLDSASLWSLSLVNLYIRKVCYNLLKNKGITYITWRKEVDSLSPENKATRWISSPQVWSFSKVFGDSSINSWIYKDTPSLAAHIVSCDIYKSLPKTDHSNIQML